MAEFHKYRNPTEGQRWAALAERLSQLQESAQRSVLRSTQYAHYTSAPVIGSIWRGLTRLGFTGGKVLEPGMGIGNFAMLMPDAIQADSFYTGIEFDGPTAQIAKLLLPRQNVLHADFTKRKLPRDYYDLAIGNPPFAKTKITSDPEYAKQEFALHDYFFAKSIDRVRPGGLLVFVTSRYTMDKQKDTGRRYLAERADLVGAVRLPQTAFRDNAGTDVVTDVLFLRKRLPGEAAAGAAWANLAEVESRDKDGKLEGTLQVNEYFAAHPEMVLGQTRIGGTGAVDDQGRRINALHPGALVVVSYDTDAAALEQRFDEAIGRLPANVYAAMSQETAAVQQQTLVRDFDPKEKREGVLYLGPDGAVLRTESGVGVALRDVEKLTAKDEAWLAAYVRLRDAVQEARFAQLHDDAWKPALRKLNAAYAGFVKDHGNLLDFRTQARKGVDDDGEPTETVTRIFKNRRLWRMDYDAPLVIQLEDVKEDGSIVKGPFLLGRTVARPVTREIRSAADALAVSLDAKGALDLKDVAERAGVSEDEAIEALGDLVYRTPQGQWQLADEYLSGYVRDKLAEAQEAARTDPRLERNVAALERAQPAPLGPQQIGVQLGAGWVPERYVSRFSTHELGAGAVSYDAKTETWQVEGGNQRKERQASAEWGTEDKGASEILEAVLNNRQLVVKRTEDKKTYTDPAATARVNDIAKKMRQAFKSWVWTDAKRATDLLDIYNTQINNIALRRFDGSHLTLPGVSLRFKLYPHQKRAIWRVVQSGNTYLAHAVGAGKTMEMIAAGMEQRRLGLIQKPMYVVPNHMLEQFSNEFMQTYPLANLLVADDENFSKERRRQFVAATAMNNLDAVIITHSAFKRLGVKEETAIPIRDAILDELRDALSDTEKDDRVRRGQLENQIAAVEQRFDKIMQKGQDQVIPFEDLGADFLFVDEAHNHRKLDFTTNRKLKGVDPGGSWAAMDLYVKTRYLEGQRPGRAFVMASGTPVTNTVGELFTIQRFFSEDAMRREGASTFDAWANMFGEVASDFERNAAGKLEPVERFAAFQNVPELMNRVRMFMDVLTGSHLGDLVKRPDLAGGKPNMILVDPTPELTRYMREVLEPRLEASKKWKPSKQEPNNPDPVVAIINDARLASIDMRYWDPGLSADTPSKLNRLGDQIAADYLAGRDLTFTDEAGKPDAVKGSTQMVFFNMGLGAQVQKNRGFNARKALTDRIVAGGVPKAKIAWFEDANTDAKKEAVFSDMRSGKVAVLIGSAKKMGTGVNVQRRLEALQYLDPPWYPADVEQPHGRIIRQGNQNQTVKINWYSTKETYEATMWQMVARKQRFIDQALSGDPSLRRIEDISEASQFEMAAALVSGDPRIMQLAEASRDVERYTRLAEAHDRNQIHMRIDLGSKGGTVKRLREQIPQYEAAVKSLGAHQLFADAQIQGQRYTKRQEAGDALVKGFNTLIATWPKTRGATMPLGSLNGGKVQIKVQVRAELQKDSTYSIDGTLIGEVGEVTTTFGWRQGTLEEKTDNGAHVGAVLTWANGLTHQLDSARATLQETFDDIAAIKRRIGAPFEYQQELAEATEKLGRLRQELLDEGKEIPTDDAAQALAAAAADMDSEGGGQATMFSRPVIGPQGRVAADEAPAGLTAAQVQGVVDGFGAGLLGASKGRVQVRVVARQEDAFGPASRDRDGRVRGAWDPRSRTVVLVAEHLDSLEQARTVLRHEVVGHFGLDLLDPAGKAEFLNRVLEAADGSRTIRQIRAQVERAEGPGADRLRVAEEVFARVAESGRSDLGSAWDRLLLWLRSKLRALGLIQGRPGLTEMRVFAADLARGIRAGQMAASRAEARPTAGVRFSGQEQDSGAEAVIRRATPGRQAQTLEQARSAAVEFVGESLVNVRTRLEAVVSNGTLGKMTSQKAVAKSTSPEDHALAVANIDQLFRHALLDRSHPDKHGEPTIAAIHRYVAPMIAADGEVRAVKMVVKETTGPKEPNPLYTIETLDVEKPTRVAPSDEGIERGIGVGDGATTPTGGLAQNIVDAIQNVKDALADRPRETGVRFSQDPNSPAFAADMQAQARFLDREAKSRHFGSLDELATRDLDTFVRLAEQWRDEHPASYPEVRFSRDALLASTLDAGGSPIGGGRRLWDSIKAVVDGTGEWAGDRWRGALPQTLGAVTLRQLADLGAKHIPGIVGYTREQQRMDTRRNEMIEESGVFAGLWESWARKKENLAQAEEAASLMHAATLAQVDPSDYKVLTVALQLGPGELFFRNREATKENVQELLRKARELTNSSKSEDRGMGGYYQAAAKQLKAAMWAEKRRKAALPELERRWAALSDGKTFDDGGKPYATREAAQAAFDARAKEFKGRVVFLHPLPAGGWVLQEMGGKQAFIIARDLYEQRSKAMMEALIGSVQASKALDPERKAKLAKEIRQEFEQTVDEKGNPRIGPYFPLQRFGKFYAVARRFPTGEARTFVKMDGQPFASEAAARGAIGKRTDLQGIKATPKELADKSGWVLKELGEPWFGIFESIGERRQGIASLKAAGWTITDQGLTKQAKQLQDAVSEGFIADAVKHLQDKGATDEADMLYQMYLTTLHQMSIRKHAIHRKGTAGFSNDALRAFGWNMTRLANQVAKLEHVPRLERLLHEIEDAKVASKADKSDGDVTVADAFFQELEKRHSWIVAPDNAGWTNATSALGFFYFLGASPAAALVNLTQTPILALPVLASKHGWKASSQALSKAFLDVSRGFSPGVVKGFLTGQPRPSEAASLSEDERAAFAAWDLTGVRDRTAAHNLAGIGESDTLWNGPTFNRGMAIISSGFHAAEVVNRDVTLLAGYRLGRAAGLSHQEALQAAEDATWEAHFDYSNAARARYMQPNMAKLLFQFKSYGMHMAYFMGRNLYQSIKGESAEVRQEARTKFLGVMGMTGLFAGTLGLPMLGMLFTVMNLVAMAFGDDDEPWDTEIEFRNLLARWFPSTVADILDRGAVTKLTGLDWSSRVGLNGLLYRSADRDLNGAGTYQHLMENLAGPIVGGIAMSPFTAYDLLQEGHWERAAEAIAPKFLKDALKAGRFANEGVLTRQGYPIVEREQLNPYQLVWKALGMNPDEIAVRQDANAAEKLYEKRIEGRRQQLMAAYALATRHGDQEAQANLLPKISAFNQAQPGWPITPRSIRSSVRTAARNAAQAAEDHGMVINRKVADQVREAGAFGE